MHYIWNGEWPDNRSPQVDSMLLDGKRATGNVTLTTGQTYAAVVAVIDHENDELAYRWELKPESDATQVGGAFEESITNLAGLVEASAGTAQITAPLPGEYRLFVYAYDDHGHAAHANIPFLVLP